MIEKIYKNSKFRVLSARFLQLAVPRVPIQHPFKKSKTAIRKKIKLKHMQNRRGVHSKPSVGNSLSQSETLVYTSLDDSQPQSLYVMTEFDPGMRLSNRSAKLISAPHYAASAAALTASPVVLSCADCTHTHGQNDTLHPGVKSPMISSSTDRR